jgi:uncharacterized membrane protein
MRISYSMTKQRLEAFSDGVIAILITIMVLELKVPHGAAFDDIVPLLPVFLSYVLSYVNLGIYWNNHHHMLHLVDHINGRVLWANLHLLFWLSLVPFMTAWMGENHNAPLPTACMGGVLLCSALAFDLLVRAIVAQQGPNSKLMAAVGKDRKGQISRWLYAAAIPLAFVHQWLSDALYVLVAVMWFAPDPRIERSLKKNAG